MLKNVFLYSGAMLLLAAAGWIAYLAVKLLFPVLLPFLLALILSMLLERPVRWLERRLRLPRGVAVCGVLLAVLGAVGVTLTWFVVYLVDELSRLMAGIPAYKQEVQYQLQRILAWSWHLYGRLPTWATGYLDQNLTAVANGIHGFVARVVNSLLRGLAAVPGVLLVLLVALLATYFLGRDRPQLVRWWLRWLPEPWGVRTLEAVARAWGAFGGYVRAQVILASITTVIALVGLRVIGSSYVLSLGLTIGLFDLLPILGPSAIFLPWLAWCLATGGTVLAVKLLILYGLILVVRQLLEARVVAAAVGLHPLAALVAMYGGLKLLGVGGLILGPILFIALQAFARSAVDLWRTRS